MKENGIYDPSGCSLPALKIKKRKSRKNIENDSTVKKLIESKLLLDSEFNPLYLKIFNKSNEINDLFKILSLNKKKNFLETLFSIGKEKKFSSAFIDMCTELIIFISKMPDTYNRKKEIKEDWNSKFNRTISIAIREKLIELSKKIQDDLCNFEEKKNINLSILSGITIYFCKKCNNIISLGKFKRCECSCGEKVDKVSQVDQIPVHYFNEKLNKFLESNYWFEHGVDYILRKKNLQTKVGYDVLGNSGVWHEIDNIAYCKNENYRFFCECKTSKVAEKDVFIFSGKMIDIGGISGYIFTASENVSKEINRLARSKNIEIIKDVLKKDIKTLVNDIKEG